MPYQDSTKMIINKFLYQMVTIKEMIEKDPMQFDLLNSFVLGIIMAMNVFSGGVMTSSILMKDWLRRLREREQLEFTHAIVSSRHLPTDTAQKEISSDQNRKRTTKQSTLTHTVIRSGLRATNITNTEMIQICLQPGYRYVNDGNKYSPDPDYGKYIGLLKKLPEELKKVLDKEEELIRKVYDIYGECMFGGKEVSVHEIPKGMDEWRDEFLDRYQNVFGNISEIMTTDNNNTVMFRLININHKIGMLSTQRDHLCKITNIKCGKKHELSPEYYNNAVEYLSDLQSLINNIIKNEEKSYFYTAKVYVSKSLIEDLKKKHQVIHNLVRRPKTHYSFLKQRPNNPSSRNDALLYHPLIFKQFMDPLRKYPLYLFLEEDPYYPLSGDKTSTTKSYAGTAYEITPRISLKKPAQTESPGFNTQKIQSKRCLTIENKPVKMLEPLKGRSRIAIGVTFASVTILLVSSFFLYKLKDQRNNNTGCSKATERDNT